MPRSRIGEVLHRQRLFQQLSVAHGDLMLSRQMQAEIGSDRGEICGAVLAT
jgi:hypothetical protein